MTRVYLEAQDEYGQTTTISYDVEGVDMSPGDWQFMFESLLKAFGHSSETVLGMFTKDPIADDTWRAIKEAYRYE